MDTRLLYTLLVGLIAAVAGLGATNNVDQIGAVPHLRYGRALNDAIECCRNPVEGHP